MKRVLILDRDGTLIIEPPDEQVDALEKLEFYPGVITWLGRIAAETDYDLVIATNQDGMGGPSFPVERFRVPHEKMLKTFLNEGIRFSDILIDSSVASENKQTRKPGTAMFSKYQSGEYDLGNSYVIGDRVTDVELARNLGSKAILLNDGGLRSRIEALELEDSCRLITTSWEAVYREVKPRRRTTVQRNTSETQIHIELSLDGSGKSKISTGIGFLDHMLEQVARHGGIDLNIEVKGDLHIDEHHTIEDTALTLGEAFNKALGERRGISRYGFVLPMDDALAEVAVDFGGRPWIVWEVDFRREKIGEMPTEMFFHFFKSFTDTARCTLNVKANGINEHHKIEAVFKAFAKAVAMAVKEEDGDRELPTTKGRM